MKQFPVQLIDSPALLTDCLERLRGEALVGIDTEAASFHRYRDRIYLLQLSTRSATFVVDPIASGGLASMADWMLDPRTEFVFHDADYDLRLFRLEYGIRVNRLFDTRVAAQFLNEPGVGLAALLSARYGVHTDKRFQRADWSLRPLAPEMIAYAATDTHYLPRLSDELRAELSAKGRLAWVEEECELLTTVEWAPPDPPELTYLRIKGARRLDRRGLGILRELSLWREDTAGRLDRAPFRILGNDAMLGVATLRPRTVAELEKISGIGRDTIIRRGANILEAVERAMALPDRELPVLDRGRRPRPDPAFDRRLERLKDWRKSLSERIGLPPGLVAPNALLENVARRLPRSNRELLETEGMRRWQVAEFGDELLRELEQPPA